MLTLSALAAIRVTCTGSCGVSSKANDAAWVAEESYFHSSLSLAEKGESGSQGALGQSPAYLSGLPSPATAGSVGTETLLPSRVPDLALTLGVACLPSPLLSKPGQAMLL